MTIRRLVVADARLSRALNMAPKALAIVLGIGVGAIPWQAHAAEATPWAQFDLDYAAPKSDTQPLNDEFLVRRARLGLKGTFNEDWSFWAAYDFALGGEFKDVGVAYGHESTGRITIGQFKVPFGLDELMSSKTIMMVERALPTTSFSVPRRLGVGFSRAGKRQTFSVMGFGPSINDRQDEDADAGAVLGAAARYTIAPIETDGTLLHLGIAAAFEHPLDDEVEVGTRPESRPTNVFFADTGELHDVNHVLRLGLELAWQTGPFTVQAEQMQAHVARQTDPAARLDGWYVSGSWMFNGGHRNYSDGKFDSPSLGAPWRTWELTARLSHVNLNDGQVQGGWETNFTLGLNWYLRDYGRVMLDYIKVRSNRQGLSDNPDILLLQAQVYF